MALAAALALPAGGARANGRFPKADHLTIAPDNPDFMVLRTTFGILVSKDHGGTWDWVCEKALGYGGVEDPAVAILGNTAITLATFEGLAVSQDGACNWAFVGDGLKEQVVVDIVVSTAPTTTALALTNKYASTGDGGVALFSSQIFQTTDGAKTWSPLGPKIDPTLVIETLEIAATDPSRVYLSAVRDTTSKTSRGVLLVSTDHGAHFTEYLLPLDPKNERAPFLAAVDPKNALRVYIRTGGSKDGTSRLLVSDDGGKSFRSVFTGKGKMLGFALSEDGTKIFLGGPADGLQIASAADLVFSKQSDVVVQCLTVRGATLYACSMEASGFILGSSQDEGKTFAPVLHLATVRGPLKCPAGSSAAICVPEWNATKETLGITPDAGPVTPTASPAAPAHEVDGSSSMRGLAIFAVLVALGGLAVVLRRRRRR